MPTTTHHTVTVYSKPDCQPCTLTKRVLAKAGIPYVEKPATDRLEEFKDRGFVSSPVVIVTDESGRELHAWSGFRLDEMYDLAEEVG